MHILGKEEEEKKKFFDGLTPRPIPKDKRILLSKDEGRGPVRRRRR